MTGINSERYGRDETFAPLKTVVLGLNGPPGVGKDTLAEAFVERNPKYTFRSMKEALWDATADHYGFDRAGFKELATTRELKDKILPSVILTPRQMMITVAETVIKPRKGDRFFGEAMVDWCKETGCQYLVTDIGFEEECMPLREHFDRFSVLRLHRDDCDWGDDSRRYVHADFPHNDCDIFLEYGQLLQPLDYMDKVAELLEMGYGYPKDDV